MKRNPARGFSAEAARLAGVLLAWTVVWVWTGPLQSQAAPVAPCAPAIPNAEFDQGDAAPAGWTLSGGDGRWVDRQFLEVTGHGEDSSFWRSDGYPFVPGGLYHFRMRAQRLGGSDTVIAGPAFANRDYRGISSQWKWFGHVFRVPDRIDAASMRLGQWHATGTCRFDAVQILSAIPVHRVCGELVLGNGESIRDGRYRFSGTFAHAGSNYHRTLAAATASFNSDRWCFGGGSRVTYRFGLPGYRFLSGKVSVNVNYHVRGGCLIEVSRDGAVWRLLATQSEVGVAEAELPAEMLPADTIYVRLNSSSQNDSFQVNRVEFDAPLDPAPPTVVGETVFADVEAAAPGLRIERILSEGRETAGQKRLRLTLRNTGRRKVEASLAATASAVGSAGVRLPSRTAEIGPGQSAELALDVPAGKPGQHELALAVTAGQAEGGFVKGHLTYSVPDYYRTDYGRLLSGGDSPAAVWWCDATHKIPRSRALPAKMGVAAQLSAARNDHEAVQIVVRPRQTLRRLTATAGPLIGPDGAAIPAANVKILRVYYHFVHHPTDATGTSDWWPDALPPLDEPIDVPAGRNQPLWVLVRVPPQAKAGDYSGRLSLKGDGFSATVPIKLHVWDFTLPERNHLQTAFGLSVGDIFRYHNLKTEADKRRVLDMYLECFAEHRISPYDPVPMDPIRVKFLPDADPPRAELDFTAFDRAMRRAVEKFHFTGYRLPIQGMGGGTFHGRHQGQIGRFGHETPEYQAMFSSYVRQLESHLREKGWLDMAYVYWFDEPTPRDYDFVAAGMRRLKKHAPGLARMLTEEPGENVLAGTVDIWCPVSPNYDQAMADKRRAHGERFWWYVCCGPKAPYCTLFIDHPATELRVWHWQTWQRNIVGTLVWRANYWTSTAAYPDTPQNPYEDPMGYVSGYSTPRGVKRYWGNGDGRFVYPPPAAAVPGLGGGKPVIQPPAASIRWEMIREGVEDYEYLYRLRELVEKRRKTLPAARAGQLEALLEVPESITRDMTTFTTDPAPIYARRKAIAEAIEQLTTD